MLDLHAPELTGPPEPGSVRTVPNRSAWTAVPDPALPDATGWSATLAQALLEVLQGRRGPDQLSRWVEEPVLAALTVLCRRRILAARHDPRAASRQVPVTQLQSIRVQHPTPNVAEVAAHLRRGRRSSALAFRLEAREGRWLCVAVELGPRSAE